MVGRKEIRKDCCVEAGLSQKSSTGHEVSKALMSTGARRKRQDWPGSRDSLALIKIRLHFTVAIVLPPKIVYCRQSLPLVYFKS